MSATDCNGKPIDIGDKVRTNDGRVILVGGMARRTYRADDCECVPKNTPLGKAATSSKAADDGDTVVWGND